MAFMQVSTAPSREEYERVTKAIDFSDRPAGLILHAAAELPSGEVQIVSVYESLEQFEAFRDNRLFPAFAETGMIERIQTMEPPLALEAFELVR